jgi:hypothetical protein
MFEDVVDSLRRVRQDECITRLVVFRCHVIESVRRDHLEVTERQRIRRDVPVDRQNIRSRIVHV